MKAKLVSIFPTFLIGILICFTFLDGCKSTTEVRDIHDTLWTTGPAFIRFLSMLPNASGSVILREGPDVSSPPFASADLFEGNAYIPIQDSTPLTLYANFAGSGGKNVLSIVSVPGLQPHSLTTCVLFSAGQDLINIEFANDSAKLQHPSDSMSYFRLFNGIADWPQPSPKVNVDLGDKKKPLFIDRATGIPVPVGNSDFQNYIMIDTGLHTMVVRDPNTQDSLYSAAIHLKPGVYYTGRLVGNHSNSTDRFTIDTE